LADDSPFDRYLTSVLCLDLLSYGADGQNPMLWYGVDGHCHRHYGAGDLRPTLWYGVDDQNPTL